MRRAIGTWPASASTVVLLLGQLCFWSPAQSVFGGVRSSADPTADVAANDKVTVEEVAAKDHWLVAQGRNGSKPLVVRYRAGFESRPDISDYPFRITLTAAFEADELGLPRIPESTGLDELEDRLAVAEREFDAVLVAVVTGLGQRQWVFYARDAARTTAVLAQGAEPSSLRWTIRDERDATWSFLYDLILGELQR